MFTLQDLPLSIDLWGAFFCLIAVTSVLIGKPVDKKGAVKLIALILCSMLLLISDAISLIFRDNVMGEPSPVVRTATFFAFFFGFLEMPLVAEYLTHLMVSRSNLGGLFWKFVEWVLFVTGTVLILVNLNSGFLYTVDERGIFHQEVLSMVPGIICVLGIIISIGVVMQYYQYFIKFEKAAFISFLLLPLGAIFLHFFRSDISLTMASVTISVLLLFYSYEVNLREYQIELERNLADRQITMFHHQIQPHFIFNSLAVIKYQCRKSPETAMDLIDEFSDYLRGCTDLLNTTDCVAASRELDLVTHYVNLQKERFDNVDVLLDIQDTDFVIPPFSLQTIVENAFTHGMRGQSRENLLIHTRNRYSVNTKLLKCDYFDFITGGTDSEDGSGFQGEFMTQYSWAEQFIYMLERIKGEDYDE